MESGIERTLQRINEHIEGIGDFYDDDFLSLQAIAEARLRNDSLLFNLAKRLNKLFQQKDGMPKEEWKAQAKEIVRQETENLQTNEIEQRFEERFLEITTRYHDVVGSSSISKAQHKELKALEMELGRVSLPDKKRKKILEKILKFQIRYWVGRKKGKINATRKCSTKESRQEVGVEIRKIIAERKKVKQKIKALQ